MNENHEISLCKPLKVLTAFIPRPKPNGNLTVLVLKRKPESIELPICWLIVCFGNVVYQIFVPTDIDVSLNNVTLKLTRYPLPFEFDWPYGDLTLNMEDLTSQEFVRDRKLPITHSFEEAVLVNPSNLQ